MNATATTPTAVRLLSVLALVAAWSVLTSCEARAAATGSDDTTHAGAAAAPAQPAAPGKEPWRMFTKPSDEELRSKLSSTQYDVTQHEGTEPPFRNEYWDNHQDGIYV